MSQTQIAGLAQTIGRETEKVEAWFKSHDLPLPGFDVASPEDFPNMPEDIATSRREVIHATKELHDLMVGPRESVRWLAWDYLGIQSLQILIHFEIPKLVPPRGCIELSVLQTKTTLDSINLARLLRFVMTKHVFCEPSPGLIGHTAASRLLVEDDALRAWVGFNAEDAYPACGQVKQALVKYPEATGMTRTGYNFAFDTVDEESMFVTFSKDPKRARRMALAMNSLTGGEGNEISHLVDQDCFSEVDARGGTLVDMGGSHGTTCVELAKKYRNMKFIVQDLLRTVNSVPNPVTTDTQIAKRVSFQAHDFFTEQTVQADVYLFRWVMHSHSKPYAVKILKSLIPALKPGARIVINDHCLREPGTETPWDEKLIRSMDVLVMALLNAQERLESEFRELFELADSGFVFTGVMRPKGSRMSIVEAVWKPKQDQNGTAAQKKGNNWLFRDHFGGYGEA